MAAVAMFYHLTRAGLDDTVAMIVTRATGQGWRVMLRGKDPACWAIWTTSCGWVPRTAFCRTGWKAVRMTPISRCCWGRVRSPTPRGGWCLLSGAEVQPDEVAGLERVWLLFDGADEAAVQAARGQWTRLTGWGMAAQYWADDSGAWVKKVEKAAALA